jgi:hypothetical protein
MKCGACGSLNAYTFEWLGVISIRCPDCGADLMPGVVIDHSKSKREEESDNEH